MINRLYRSAARSTRKPLYENFEKRKKIPLRVNHVDLSQIGADRVKRLQSFAFIMRAARGFAVDGDKIVPTGPERLDPVFKTPSEQKGIDAITRMTEKHYAHLSPNYVAETIRQSFPNLGLAEKGNVTALGGKK